MSKPLNTKRIKHMKGIKIKGDRILGNQPRSLREKEEFI